MLVPGALPVGAGLVRYAPEFSAVGSTTGPNELGRAQAVSSALTSIATDIWTW
jgi:hypothetical protein